MRVKRNILIFIAIVLIVCYGLAAFMSEYYLAKQEDKAMIDQGKQWWNNVQ